MFLPNLCAFRIGLKITKRKSLDRHHSTQRPCNVNGDKSLTDHGNTNRICTHFHKRGIIEYTNLAYEYNEHMCNVAMDAIT